LRCWHQPARLVADRSRRSTSSPCCTFFVIGFFRHFVKHRYRDFVLFCTSGTMWSRVRRPRAKIAPRRNCAKRDKSSLLLWDAVKKLVKQIPRGRVLSYGAVAKILRLPGGARSAGRAMAATPHGRGIPWHRVLAASGKILIREPYSSLQRKLLESEGVEVVESRVRMKKNL